MAGAIKPLFDAQPAGRHEGTRIPGLATGVVMGVERDGRPVVSWEGSGGPRASEVVRFDRAPDWGACCGARVLLGFLDGDEARPVVVGLLDRPPAAEGEETSAQAAAEKPTILKIESEQELILECGKAKIALRADGRVQILGGYVVSQSTGVNKIRGGSVQIN